MATCTGDQYVQNIERTECIGNSLVKINNNFKNLDIAVCELENRSLSAVDSSTIDLNWDINTRTLSAMANESITSYLVPTGVIVMWSGPIVTIPTGWALCDGLNGTPDLRNRFIIGAHSGTSTGTLTSTGPAFNATTGTTENYAPGNVGGSGSVKLLSDQLPIHRHTITDPTHKHSYLYAGSADDGGNGITGGPGGSSLSSGINNASTGITQTNLTGGDQYHENRPPYYALAYIMKL